MLPPLEVPIVQAPMAGGPSTPALAAAVCEAGGLGFVAAGYKAPDALLADVEATVALTRRPFGVNLFAPSGTPADPATVAAYAARLGGAPGAPRFDDDGFGAKVDLLCERPVVVVSLTFGCPADAVARLRAAGSEVWATVTAPDEAVAAADAGVDALVAQGVEAGGHRGTWIDRDDAPQLGLLALLALIRARVDLPLIASGAVATRETVAAVLAAGATAAQVGSALLRCPEAGTSDAHLAGLDSGRPTGLTRAFSGRLARGIVNRFQADHSPAAPIAYPELHHVTTPLRAAARAAGDPEGVNLWAGQAYELAQARPAAEVVRELAS